MTVDEWGADPGVRQMRRVFGQMELAQDELLKTLSISPLDQRLRPARDMARRLFEAAWQLSGRKGHAFGEPEIGKLYAHCLVYGLRRNGASVSEEQFQPQGTMERLLREVTG